MEKGNELCIVSSFSTDSVSVWLFCVYMHPQNGYATTCKELSNLIMDLRNTDVQYFFSVHHLEWPSLGIIELKKARAGDFFFLIIFFKRWSSYLQGHSLEISGRSEEWRETADKNHFFKINLQIKQECQREDEKGESVKNNLSLHIVPLDVRHRPITNLLVGNGRTQLFSQAFS